VTPVDRLRLCVLPSRQALPWRWDLAQLELGCRSGWPLPGTTGWAQRTQSLATDFNAEDGHIALAFEGYALVGALWSHREQGRDIVCGPYVMPQYRNCELAQLLLRVLRP
jgi:hypothetical protein